MPSRLSFAHAIEPVRIDTARIEVSRDRLRDLQVELARAKILDAAFDHMQTIGVDPGVAAFELTFGLKF